MSTDAPRSEVFNRKEPIPGYRTVKLLGRGGCGEVWQAIAPGGISKAIKIVYGEVDVDPANANDTTTVDLEQRALNRIKDVRHPMLLSIERAEMICGNLVIVTELADCSLKQHFLALRRMDKVGVPQDELFKYIGDTADALDYLYTNYSLQHLDVKPENILIVSGRAKLGDFGLVKNLYERSVSIVGGLTPTYAAPELFEGRPDRHSDQYSLALVYMHMLTGELPFSSGNTAQIANQHLRGVPNLSALPKPQQKVIARALSKDPALRFETCTALVDALKKAATEVDPIPDQNSARGSATAVSSYSNYAVDALHRAPTIASTNSKSAAARETRLDPKTTFAMDDAAAHNPQQASPIILLGVGGAAVDILAKFVARLNDRFGSSENWPPVEIVAMDSQTKTLSSRFQMNDLDRVRIVPIPLKPVESLGGDAKQFLKWLDRRWLYNIPRDNTTGGYRPFGRLALAMNAKRVRDELSAVISQVANSATRQSEPGTGPTPRIAPRVLVIGSICGGTGSGAILDLSYAVRSELTRRGLSDEHVHGLLLQGTPRNNADRDKARANAYSTLLELEHYSRPGSYYPGEPLLNATPFHGNNATFARTHLLHLGDALGPHEWNLATDTLAEFVYSVTCTPARDIVDNLPGQTETSHNVRPLIQSHHVVSLGAGSNSTVAAATQLARMDVVKFWREGRAAQPEPSAAHQTDRTVVINTTRALEGKRSPEIDSYIQQQFTEYKLDLPDLHADAAEVVALETGIDSAQFVAQLVNDCLKPSQDNPSDPRQRQLVLKAIDLILQSGQSECANGPQSGQLFIKVVDRLNSRSRTRVNALLQGIRHSVDKPEVRIEGARKNAVAFQHLLQSVLDRSQAHAVSFHETKLKVGALLRSEQPNIVQQSPFLNWERKKRSPEDERHEALKFYAEASFKELLHRAIVKVIPVVLTELTTLIEQLDRIGRQIGHLVDLFQVSPNGDLDSDNEPSGRIENTVAAYGQILRSQLQIRRQQIAYHIDNVIQRQLEASGHGFHQFLESDAELNRLIGQPMLQASQQAIQECIHEINSQFVEACRIESENGDLGKLSSLIATSFAEASTAIQSHTVNRYMIFPGEVEASQSFAKFQSHLGVNSIIAGHKCDITLWTSRPPMTLENTADEIIDGVEIYKELARRLHTRIDVEWGAFADCEIPNFAPSYEPSPEIERTQRVGCR